MSKLKQYDVPFTITVSGIMKVEAENVDDAVDVCCDEATFDSYCGNGGCDKLIGTTDERISFDGSIDINEINENEVSESE